MTVTLRTKEKALQPLNPREIQARVRAGASPEVVAAETGWDLDRVQRYAEPPLAERSYIADRAKSVQVRKGATLDEVTTATWVSDGVAPATAHWDAWRREDGKWIVVATYPRGKSQISATWTFDTAGSNLHPQDDAARHLMGVDAAPAIAQETPIEFISEEITIVEETTISVVDDSEIIEALRDAAESESVRPRLVAVRQEDIDAIDEVTMDQTVALLRPLELDLNEITPGGHPVPATPDELSAAPAKKAPAKKSSRSKRASIPSWDEILFGGSRNDDQ